MFVRDGYADVACVYMIHLSDFPPALGIPIYQFIERRRLYHQDWAQLYFALLAEPDDPQLFPWGKQATLDILEDLLRRQWATDRDRARSSSSNSDTAATTIALPGAC